MKLDCRTGGCCPEVDPMGTFLFLHVSTDEACIDADRGRIIIMLTRKQLEQALDLIEEK